MPEILKLYLFGSIARNENTDESNLDLAVKFPTSKQ